TCAEQLYVDFIPRSTPRAISAAVKGESSRYVVQGGPQASRTRRRACGLTAAGAAGSSLAGGATTQQGSPRTLPQRGGTGAACSLASSSSDGRLRDSK